ncbi:hypothetical protein EV702DRAFT_793358 [Suillus placidus]|uniref:Beta-lactamase-related domain-containing protein n=1 Tax=Suillus placidus TaxID=48579 RepID=A0A9P6ZI95_9AGAM|nr:hypothetical protein EV702DRAFT_793358 [Suillus placidus]
MPKYYHAGSVPGCSRLASFLPNDDVGVVVFANGGDKVTSAMNISNRIIDAVLNLRSKQSPLIKPNTPEKKTITPLHENVVRLELFAAWRHVYSRRASVWKHDRGAVHLVDPGRVWARQYTF